MVQVRMTFSTSQAQQKHPNAAEPKLRGLGSSGLNFDSMKYNVGF